MSIDTVLNKIPIYFNYTNENISILIITYVIILVLAIPIVAIGAWLTSEPSTKCLPHLNMPFLVLAILIMVLCLGAIYCSINRIGLTICCNCCIIFVVLSILLGYTIFALVVAGPGAGEPLANRAYKEYRLERYSNWLQNWVSNSKNWDHVKECLSLAQVCSRFQTKYANDSQLQFFSRSLSSIESGCCKPSDECKFNYTSSPIEWTKPKDGGGEYTNKDCYTWDNNDPNMLCFDCGSCKAGVAHDVKTHWQRASIPSFIFTLFIFLFYILACFFFFFPNIDFGECHDHHSSLAYHYRTLDSLDW